MKKRIILSTLVLSVFAITAHAQYFGLKGGVNFSNLYVDDADDENIRTGFHAGVFAQADVSDGFAIQPELLFSTKGATFDYNNAFFEGESTFKVNYIDLPILGVFKLGDIAEIHIGPYFGYLVNSSFESDGEFLGGDDSPFGGDFEGEDEFDNDSFKSLDYGVVGGLALNFGPLSAGARYNYGLQEIQDSDAAEAFLGDAKNSYIQVFAALRIGDYD